MFGFSTEEVGRLNSLKTVSSFYEVTEKNTVFRVGDDGNTWGFIISYEDRKGVMNLELFKEGEGLYEVSLISRDFSFIDMNGLNALAISKNFRKLVNTLLSNNVKIEKLIFRQMPDFLNINQVNLMLSYLQNKNIKIEDLTDLEDMFLAESKKDLAMPEELVSIRRFIKKYKKDESFEDALSQDAKLKRFNTFFTIAKRALRGINVEFDISTKPDFVVTFK